VWVGRPLGGVGQPAQKGLLPSPVYYTGSTVSTAGGWVGGCQAHLGGVQQCGVLPCRLLLFTSSGSRRKEQQEEIPRRLEDWRAAGPLHHGLEAAGPLHHATDSEVHLCMGASQEGWWHLLGL
jgi:hypothetical protein